MSLLVEKVTMAEEHELFDKLCQNPGGMNLPCKQRTGSTETLTALSLTDGGGPSHSTGQDVVECMNQQAIKLIKACVCIILQHIIAEKLCKGYSTV